MMILGDILEELGVIAFARQEDKSFKLLGNPCAWFMNLLTNEFRQKNSADFSIPDEALCQRFPFIENFLIDAEKTWQTPKHLAARSGIWTEEDASGTECQLEGFAYFLQGQAILLIENHSTTFQEQHAIFQKARDMALLNEKLVSELNQRQRELQSEIEKRILQNASILSVAESVKSHTSAVMICQPNGQVEVMNNALIDIYELDYDLETERTSLLDQWVKEAEEQYPELKQVIEKGSYWEGEFESKGSEGESRWIRLTIGPVREKLGQISHYICVANDISEFKLLDASIGDDEGFDATTHLPNRRHFWRHMQTLSESARIEALGIGLLYIDLDYFKRVNDDLGHQAGDFLLSTIASRISRNVKHNDFVAHLGGDEFSVVINKVENNEQIEAVADRLLMSIQESLSVDGQPINMSASIGIAVNFGQGFDPAQLVKQADLAMYTAKELGKGQAIFYEPDMDITIPRKLRRERELVNALENREFVLYLQPQIGVQANQQLRAEALIRWQHPELGILQPAEFITIAEDSGLIIPIGTWVLKSACLIGADLIKQGKEINISVNISVKQLKHPDFYKVLVESLEESTFPPSLLELEITESCFLEDLNGVINLIEKIRCLGISISLDDFGTGFSSLNYLRQIPVDFLKIDKSFVQELSFDKQRQAIISFVIRLAHELDIKVIAEGVETQDQLSFLNSRQVNFIQGYFFYKPMSVDDLARSLPKIEALNQQVIPLLESDTSRK